MRACVILVPVMPKRPNPFPRSCDSLRATSTLWLACLILASAVVPHAAFGQADGSLRTASAALRQQDFNQALKFAQAGLAATPNDVRLLTLEGLAYAGKHDPQPALAAFKHALKLAPTYLPALEAAAQLAFEQHDSEARPLLARILSSHPEEPTANAMLASLDYRANDCPGAVEHFARARNALALEPEGLMQYGACLGSLNRPVEAIPVLAQAVQLAPQSTIARFNLALAQSNAGAQGGADAALETLAPLLAQPAPGEDVLTLAADLAEANNNTQRAVELLRKAILAYPRDKAAYLQFAYLSYKHSSMQVGIDMVNVGIAQLPKEPELYLARGILLSQMADINKASEDFDTASRLDPNLTFAQAAQGIARSQAHDAPAALATFRAAAKEHPEDSLTQYLLAEELSNQAPEPGTAAFKEGVTAASRSIALDPKRVEAHDLLAALYLRSGEMKQSIEQSQAALAIDPEDEQALYHQILALRKSDRKAEVPALVERMMKLREQKATQAKSKVYRLVEADPATAATKP